jgi:hypothetical protein
LAVPLTLHFEGHLDSGGPFGIFLARRPIAINSPEKILRAAFNMNVTGFAPRPGFSGDVSHGAPPTPDPRTKYRPPGPNAGVELQPLLEKLNAIKAQHPECASFVVSKGPSPHFVRCFK